MQFTNYTNLKNNLKKTNAIKSVCFLYLIYLALIILLENAKYSPTGTTSAINEPAAW
ncbi:Uncharacterised protein, partial [Mycoplasmopsis edwardii]